MEPDPSNHTLFTTGVSAESTHAVQNANTDCERIKLTISEASIVGGTAALPANDDSSEKKEDLSTDGIIPTLICQKTEKELPVLVSKEVLSDSTGILSQDEQHNALLEIFTEMRQKYEPGRSTRVIERSTHVKDFLKQLGLPTCAELGATDEFGAAMRIWVCNKMSRIDVKKYNVGTLDIISNFIHVIWFVHCVEHECVHL